MLVASDDVRDSVAGALGDFLSAVFGGLVNNIGLVPWVIGGAAAALVVWRISVALGPEKVCWRCGGDGHVGGLLGGRRDCTWCDGKGRRPRIGSK